MTTYLIKNAAILGGEPTDLLLEDGVIKPRSAPISTGRRDVEVIDATGLVALPGLVDLHTHLREPGREDAETVESGTQAAALGGFTAVHAMANTDPVADTAGVVEQVWRLGREAGYCDVYPIGAVTVGLAGERLAELGAMADSAARVRVFSDDGKCVSDPLLMRRALEYVKAFDGVIAQHAQEPRLTEDAQMNEGELSGRLGLAGWPAVAEEAIIARDCLLAAHVGSRLHVCHVSTAGSVEIVRQAKEQGLERHRRGLPAPPAADRRAGGDVRPDLQGQPAAALGRRRRGAAGRAGRRHHRHRRHRPRPAPARGQGLRVGRRRVRHARPRDRAVDRAGDDGRPRPARLGRRRRADVPRPGPDRPGLRPRPAGSRRARPPTSCSTTRRPAARSRRRSRPRCRGTRRTPGGAARPGGGDVPARPPTVLDGKLT